MRFRDLKKQTTKKTTTAPAEKKINYAHYSNYPNRIKALITDLFMIYIPILYIITYVFMDGADDFQSSQVAPLVGVVLYGIIYAVFVAKTGQTPGKKAYDIQIVDATTHEKISLFRAIFRYVAFLLSASTLLGLLLPLYHKEKKALHDILAKTVVLHTSPEV